MPWDLFNAALAVQQPPPPFWVRFVIDPRALVFTAGAAMFSAVLAGSLPALAASRRQPPPTRSRTPAAATPAARPTP